MTLSYATRYPDGSLHRVLLNATVPDGSTHESLDVLPVDPTIPEGFVQDFSQGPAKARGWQIVEGVVVPLVMAAPTPEPTVRSQATDEILRRLTPEERTAIFTARQSSPALDYLLTRATAAGSIREDDPDFPTARDLLAQAGLLAAERWDQLFAP